MRCNCIRDKLLVIPGYIIGLCCLILITYRTIIAFLSENKAVTIHINRFGEQYYDIVALVIIWIVCIIGLIFLLRVLREEKVSIFPNLNRNIKPDKNKIGFLGYISKSSKDEEDINEEEVRNGIEATLKIVGLIKAKLKKINT